METKRLLKFTVLGAVLFIIIAFGAMSFVTYDVMSYTATGSEKLNPTGQATGKALIVYDPGISGNAKEVATVIAKHLQTKGYTVNLAGVNSETVENTSEYGIIVVGGPIYAGNASKSVQSYLSTLKPPKNAKVAVFATGQDADILNNPEMLKREVAPLPEGSSLKINAVTKFIEGEDTNKKCADFVNSILN